MISLGEALTNEGEAVLCFCGFEEGFWQSPEGCGDMSFEKAVCW